MFKSFIETQLPVSRVSKECYKERKANHGQTLTGLLQKEQPSVYFVSTRTADSRQSATSFSASSERRPKTGAGCRR